jgi:hypothetical protein
MNDARESPWLVVMLGLTLGALAQAAGLLGAAGHVVSRGARAEPATSYVFGAVSGIVMLVILLNVAVAPRYGTRATILVPWYAMSLTPASMWLASAYTFLCWAVFGVYRLLRSELVGDTSPLGLLAFTVFLAGYTAGLVPLLPGSSWSDRALIRVLAAHTVIAGVGYASCLHAAMNVEELRRWLVSLRAERRAAWARTPTWLAAAALSTLSGGVCAILIGNREWLGVASVGATIAAGSLIVVRDAGLLWLLRMRGGVLAGDAWATVMIACLHGLLPWILVGVGAGQFRQIFSLDPASGWSGVAVLGSETLLVAWTARVRFRLYHARVV